MERQCPMDKKELALEAKVLYKNELYSIIHIYESGYIEISKEAFFQVELVHRSEITQIY
ncbi:hypothetical protein ABET51_14305 [Metabacillus fastidiosus]|uniref:hypothetical protein n=2 Tax=Metabacillus fastidiosus TaxID=1458 RepID=UPI003D2B6A6B